MMFEMVGDGIRLTKGERKGDLIMDKDLIQNELASVRRVMRALSLDLKDLRAELSVQERRMERLIMYKESLEREMTTIKVIPAGRSGRRSGADRRDPFANLTKEQALELVKMLALRFEEEDEEDEDDES